MGKVKIPTGENVPVLFRRDAVVSLGRFCESLSFFVCEMQEDCILGGDFLGSIKPLASLLSEMFGQQERPTTSDLFCCKIKNTSVDVEVDSLLDSSHENLSISQKEVFSAFLSNFRDVFLKEVVAGNCDVVQHTIELTNQQPIKQTPRRIPWHLRTEVDTIIEEMKEQGVIEESQSPWVSPAVLVKKKDGTIRFCVDYRRLNDVTKKNSYPLPRIDDILDQLAGNVWFTTLDLKSGYWQVRLSSAAKEKAAFSIGRGLWQFTVMPFGLCNAPATFERLMEKVLHGLISKICFVYLDDVIIYGKDFDEMMENLEQVFLRIRTANLKINPKKCAFLKQKVKYLGYVISAEGIATDPEKVSAVATWPCPKSKKQVRSFLGFCSYYRKFIKGFSLIAKPLFGLTEEGRKFQWTTECQTAFDRLKEIFISPPVLSFPFGTGEFILDTDASNHGIGAVLSQVQDGEEKIIAYFSRVFSKQERNYCITRRELLAAVDAMKSFHHYLYGRRFTVRTDHISLRWLLSFRNLEGQLARWLERLQQYDFEVCYRSGKSHGNADALSRRPCQIFGCRYCGKIEATEATAKRECVARIIFSGESDAEWRTAQLRDPVVLMFLRARETNKRPSWQEVTSQETAAKVYWSHWNALVVENGVLFKKWESPNPRKSFLQVVVPRDKISEVLAEAHDSPSAGHFGVNKTLAKLRKRYYWATCKSDVENWCASCKICVARKGPSSKGKSSLQVYNVGCPFERLQVDILGPLPVSSAGNKYLLVVVDCFTKWPEAFPLKSKRAIPVAETLVGQVFSRHGIPLELHTDQGRNFESNLFKEMAALLGIQKTRTTALHPQSDGLVERQHRTILDYLSKFIAENQRDWDRWIPMFLLAFRSSKQESTGVTPAEMYRGYDLRLPLDLLRGSPPGEKSEVCQFVCELRRKLDGIHHQARCRLEISSRNMKTWYDRRARGVSFEPEQQVWFHNPRRKKGRAPKLQSSWEGPYRITRKLSDVVFEIQESPRHRKKVVHADRLAPFLERHFH